MSALTRLLLIPIALSFTSAAVAAKEIPGLPKELVGIYGKSAEVCRGYLADLKNGPSNDPAITIFREKDGTYTYGDCDAVCFAEILSYRAVRNGYAVKMRWIGSGGNRIESLSATKLGGNKLKLRFLPDGKPWNVVRCSK